MPVLSVDLAYKRYSDIGKVVLRGATDHVDVELIDLPREGVPTPAPLAEFLHQACVSRGISILLVGGPQGWRADGSDVLHSRKCERAFNTPAKTGLPGEVKPANYRSFVVFSIAVFDALTKLGWTRLTSIPSGGPSRFVIESFPRSAWRALGIPALPAKANARPQDISDRLGKLTEHCNLSLSTTPTHDQVQAIVAGLAGGSKNTNYTIAAW